ncbi:zinc dependent phospholipase C-domain-containing protein [Dipodascopsis uninucleata]
MKSSSYLLRGALLFGEITSIILQPSGVAASGISTHIHVLERARSSLETVVSEQDSFAIAGAFFPDAFYDCMSQSAEAELAHWPPFLAEAVDYYREMYGDLAQSARSAQEDARNTSSREDLKIAEEGNGLRAFLYGMFTHQIADVSWHSLGVDQGLLMAIALTEFDGDYSSAHRVLDTGGDMILMYRLIESGADLSFMNQRWAIPSKDIVEIYARLNVKINRATLEYCMARGIAALRAEHNLARSMYHGYAKKSQILFDSLDSYFLGGLDEIINSISKCAKHLKDWFENGAPPNPWTLCPVFSGKQPAEFHYGTNHSIVEEVLREYVDRILPSVITTTTPDEQFTHLEILEDSAITPPIRSHTQRPSAHTINLKSQVPWTTDDGSILLQNGIPDSHFGTSFAVGNFRGDSVGPCLAVSAPFEATENSFDGAVYVIPLVEIGSMFDLRSASESKFSIDQYRITRTQESMASDQSINPNIPLNFTLPHRFGQALAAVTYLNMTVLAVSSPGISTIDLFSGPDLILSLGPSDSSPAKTYGSSGRKLLGEHIYVDDVDNDGIPDLIVSAPQSDVFSESRSFSATKAANGRQQGEIVILSGRHIEAAIGNGMSYINMDSVRGHSIDKHADKSSLINFGNRNNFELFGTRISLHPLSKDMSTGALMFVGAPGSSSVYVIEQSTGKNLFIINGQSKSGDFGGGAILSGRYRGIDWLLVGAPSESLRATSTQVGLCYFYIIEKSSFEPNLVAFMEPDDDQDFTKFGYTGSTVIDIDVSVTDHDDASATIYISSPHAAGGMGSVWRLSVDEIISVATSVPDQGAIPVFRMRAVAQGLRQQQQTMARFGHTVTAVRTKATGSQILSSYLFVGVPHLAFGTSRHAQGGVVVYRTR